MQDAIAGFDGNGHELAVLVQLALAHGDDNAGLRLLFGGGCDEQARGSCGFGFVALHDDAIAQRLQIHDRLSFLHDLIPELNEC